MIANRGEIASRIIRACHAVGLETVLLAGLPIVNVCVCPPSRSTVCIGPAASGKSYLNRKAIVAAALGAGTDALHPDGSDPRSYAYALPPSPSLALEPITFTRWATSLKRAGFARQHGIPVLPGSEKVATFEEAIHVVDRIGVPVMMKAAAGGGGRGMKVVTDRGEVQAAFMAASAEARSAFGDETLYLERYIRNARHIEVQVLGDRHGNVITGERDCSLQRRHQKVVEEAPAPESQMRCARIYAGPR